MSLGVEKTEVVEASPPVLKRQSLIKTLLGRSGVFWALILLCIAASIASPHFLRVDNLIDVGRQIAISGIVAVGMTFVILTAGIDLSVGAIIGVVAVISASMLKAGIPQFWVIIAGLAIGGFVGAINGLGVTVGRVPAFIMTLGLMVAGRGFAMTYSQGAPIDLGNATNAFQWLGGGNWLGIPVPIWVFALVFIAGALTLKYTAFGRYVYAVGDNREAARLSGIHVGLVEFMVYFLTGILSGLAALIFVSRLTVGDPTAGTDMELDAIAMVVIGGVSLFGGEGGIAGTLIGTAIIAVLANLLNLVGISPFTQEIVKGAIIVGAVLLATRKQKA